MLGTPIRLEPGRAQPLGATPDGKGVNFALFSENAERVELCLFDESGEREVARVALPQVTDHVWHGYLRGAGPGLTYGYRVYGPFDPHRGHRFNHHKLLVDPYARALSASLKWNEANFGYTLGHPGADLSFDARDDSAYVPRSLVVDDRFDWGDDRLPRVPWDQTIIYELHPVGMTALHPQVPADQRRTLSGLASPAILEHLRSLGVTTVELMPVHPFADERHLALKGLRNYWGYNPYNFLAVEPRYLASGAIAELKQMVRRFHRAGIEVILDVVFNHTGEGDQTGPTLSFRGIDNACYYRLLQHDPRLYIDETGCGNTLNFSHPRVVQMVLDSLRYLVVEMHVDGFRFDLATTLARREWGFDPGAPFLSAVSADPILSTVKLIAEPWDVGWGGYQLGGFPRDWSEWNDKYRDAMRAYWKGDSGLIGTAAYHIAGSSGHFERTGRGPRATVNFITAHDGFTLEDLVSYNGKHNEANLEHNRDGRDDNFSWNCGVEGATEIQEIRRLRVQQKRNMIATLLLSQGVPLLLAGDEIGNTQHGNNNAYCQDNETSWIKWEELRDEDRGLLDFVRRVIAIRRAHPVFRRQRYFHGRRINGFADLTWLSPRGVEMGIEDWNHPEARCFGFTLNGDAGDEKDGEPARLMDECFAVLLNAYHGEVPFTLPAPARGRVWRLIFDTARAESEMRQYVYHPVEAYPMLGRSLVLLTGS